DCVIDNKLVFTITREIIERVTPRTRVVPVGISVENKTLATIPDHIQLVLIANDLRLIIVTTVLIVGATLLLLYGYYTNLLRDGHPPDQAAAQSNQSSFTVL